MHPNDKVISAFLLIFILMVFGTVAYHTLEGWSYVDSLYFTAMTVTTVGYGDLVPTTPESKLFTVFFAFAGISIALVILVSIGADYYRRERRFFRDRLNNYAQNRKIRIQKAKRRKARLERMRANHIQSSKRRHIFSFLKRNKIKPRRKR